MIKKIPLSVLFYFFYSLNTFCQDSVRIKANHYISLQTGYSMHYVQDEVISPLVYKGGQFPIFLKFQLLGNNSYQQVSIFYDYLQLSSSITSNFPSPSFYTQNTNVFFEYSYLRNIYKIPARKIKLFAGGTFNTLINYRDHFYGGGGDVVDYPYGEFITSIGVSFMIIKRFNSLYDNFISFRVDMPLLEYDFWNYLYNANVPKDFVSTNANDNTVTALMLSGKPVTINQYFDFQGYMSYSIFANKHIGFEISYYFQYYNSEKVKGVSYTRYLNYQFLGGLILKI